MLLASIVPGIPFIVVRRLLHGHSGIINLDYLLLTLLACFSSKRLASVLFVITYIFESLRIVDAVYLFSHAVLVENGCVLAGDRTCAAAIRQVWMAAAAQAS